MARIGDDDFSVPSVETADINDGDILNMSSTETADDGRVKFHATLPSGRQIESDWVMPDGLRKARMLWVDAVKEQIVLDAQAATQEARDRAMRAKRDIQSESVEQGASGPVSNAVNAGHVVEDPVQWAKSQWMAALLAADAAANELVIIRAKEKAAKAAASRWHKLFTGLSEDERD